MVVGSPSSGIDGSCGVEVALDAALVAADDMGEVPTPTDVVPPVPLNKDPTFRRPDLKRLKVPPKPQAKNPAVLPARPKVTTLIMVQTDPHIELISRTKSVSGYQ